VPTATCALPTVSVSGTTEREQEITRVCESLTFQIDLYVNGVSVDWCDLAGTGATC
jgi:hypothetical protein